MIEDKLAEAFDIEPIHQQEVIPKQQLLPVATPSEETETDIQYVRSNLYDLIEKGGSAIENALAVATESQSPRAYEVAGNLIKNIGDLTDKLVSLQKAKADLQPREETQTNLNIDKAVIFNGSTAELLKMIKNEFNSK
jgi:hypothetical protein